MNREDDQISEFMKNVIKDYDRIRGRDRNVDNFPFWDIIVISAADADQKNAYEMQIALKQKYGELPLGVPIHIISDPPNHKIGCGGSLLYGVKLLADIYPNSMKEKKVLFIPAGGFSQRLPSQSILGKLFGIVPIGNPVYQMIDLILAVYVPFLHRMSPGIFLTSSDAIISYFIKDKDNWSFQNFGFTALGHPSSITIGMHHGVYILPKNDLKLSTTFMSKCDQVLQKPHENLMQEKGAIISYDSGDGKKQNIVYSDSVFFIDANVISELLQFFEKHKPIQVEISSYGDFLQALGEKSNKDYIGPIENKNSYIKKELYDILHPYPLFVLALNQSSFHHLGTMTEYLDNYCEENAFTKHFSCEKFLCSSLLKRNASLQHVNGVVLHSFLHANTVVEKTSIVEYCKFLSPVHVSEHCIVSNCQIDVTDESEKLTVIPSNLLIHTVAVNNGFVTIFFHINDDLKANNKVEDISFLNRKFKDIGIYKDVKNFHSKDTVESLWNMKLFPLCPTMDKSFKLSIEIMNNILDNSNQSNKIVELNNEMCYMSMKDLLKQKNIKEMLKYREELRQYIL